VPARVRVPLGQGPLNPPLRPLGGHPGHRGSTNLDSVQTGGGGILPVKMPWFFRCVGGVRDMGAGPGETINIRALPKMVRWYSPSHLINTGWRSVVSEIFGQYADQRIMQATIDGFTPEVMKQVIGRYNYSDLRQFGDGNAVWVDYVADLGDGFDSTYAIASLISAPSLDIKGAGTLPGGKLLIMGGDQVYPFPTRKAYRERFAFPYETALPEASDGNWRRLLFVVPGNHDWYDGLNSFDFMFCKARFGHAAENRIGGWQCPQHRSYFAIRLPHNWWIWGADIQLAQYLDAGQVLYFESVAEAMKQHPTEAPKLILCTAEPTWNYDKGDTLQGEDNLSQIANIATNAGARICAVMAGDLHHYSRYTAKDVGTSFFTAGGGGAYFSPTHYLRSVRKMAWLGDDVDLKLKCKITNGKSTNKASCWPSRGKSRLLGLETLIFPVRNYGFAVCLGVFYWLMTWLYSTTRLEGTTWHFTSVGDILMKDPDFKWFPHVFLVTTLAAANNVMLGFLSLVLLIVLFVYADPRYGQRIRGLMAGLHWLAHVAMMIALYYFVSRTSIWFIDLVWPAQAEQTLESLRFGSADTLRETVRRIAVFPVEMVLFGGFMAGLVWGVYLTLSCLVGLHCDQAFASMGIANFKNFLRLKIEPNKLTIYPIGLRKAPKRWMWRKAKRARAAEGPQIVPMRPLRPTLIEGPIEIHVGDVKRPDIQPRSPGVA